MSAIPEFKLRRIQLPVLRPLIVGNEKLPQRELALIECRGLDGRTVKAELSPLPGLSRETLEESMHHAQELLQSWPELDPAMVKKSCPSAVTAVEWLTHQLRHPDERVNLAPCHTFLADCWIDTPPALPPGTRVVKIKIGRDKIERELDAIARLLKAYPALLLRLDANQLLSMQAWREYVDFVPKQHVDYWEEPVTPKEWQTNRTDIPEAPVALDELLLDFCHQGLLPDTDQWPFMPKNMILRPSLCRGMTAATALMDWASERGIGITVTSSYEGPVGMKLLEWFAARAYQRDRSICGTNTLGLFA